MRVLYAIAGADQAYEPLQALRRMQNIETIVLLHVIEVPKELSERLGGESEAVMARSIRASLAENGRQLLARMRADAAPHAAQIVERSEWGAPAEIILGTAEREAVDLIVLGGRGVRTVGGLLCGSVTQRVVSHAACSVLIINKPLRKLDHVLLALEEQSDAETAMAFFRRRPWRDVGTVDVFHAVPVTKPAWPARSWVPARLEEQLEHAAAALVTDVARGLSRLGYRTTTAWRSDSPAGAILERAHEVEADLIVIGSHCRGGEPRFPIGSVAHDVVHAAQRPILVLRTALSRCGEGRRASATDTVSMEAR